MHGVTSLEAVLEWCFLKCALKIHMADGFAVDEAGDGKEGLWLAIENPYSLIVLDLTLPGIDGSKILSWRDCAGQLRRWDAPKVQTDLFQHKSGPQNHMVLSAV